MHVTVMRNARADCCPRSLCVDTIAIDLLQQSDNYFNRGNEWVCAFRRWLLGAGSTEDLFFKIGDTCVELGVLHVAQLRLD